MKRALHSRAVRVLSLLGFGLATRITSAASEADSTLKASLSCQPLADPGRILCALAAEATNGKLAWVDALIVRAPPFARPLRSRVVDPRARAPEVGTTILKLALVAAERGTGTLDLLVRAVICRARPEGERCDTAQVPVSATIAVGLPARSAPEMQTR